MMVAFIGTADAGNSFLFRNTSYNVTQFYGLALHPTNANYFLAGAQDNGSQKFTTSGINSTSDASGGDGAFCHIDQDNGNIQITSYVYNNYFVSTNGGASFTTRSKNNSGRFINPTDYDNIANVLYAGYTTNNYFRWTDPATNGASSAVSCAAFNSAFVTHVAVSPLTSNRVYFGLNNGSIVMVNSANTGTTVTGTVIRSAQGAISVSCIAIDPSDENHMLVTYSNYGITSIYETLDAMAATPTWTAVEGDLPDMPVRWVLFDPRNTDWAIIATELGVWSTDNLNGGSTKWNPTNNGLANIRVDMLKYRSMDRTIGAATHGRGLFTTTVPTSTTPTIHFSQQAVSGSEQTDVTSSCRLYKDYSLFLVIDNPPTGDANVTVSIQGGGTATLGVDYDLTTNGSFTSPSNSFTFLSDSVNGQEIKVRVYDDAGVESNESFTLSYSISGTTTAVAGATNQTSTFTVFDNDIAPTAGTSADYTIGTVTSFSTTATPFRGDFRRSREQFLIFASELSAAGLRSGPLTAMQFITNSKGSTSAFNSFTISLGHTNASGLSTGFVSNSLTQVYTGNYTTVAGANNISFNSPFVWDGVSNILVQTCFDNGTTIIGADPIQGSVAVPSVNTSTFVATTSAGTACILNAASVSTFRPNIRFTQTFSSTSIESAINSSSSVYLGNNAEEYVYSSTDKKLMAKIKNLSSHNYGCTQISIDRAGTGAVAFWNNAGANYLMSKTFRVIPASNNASGQYEITLYYTDAEKTGWEAATGQSWSNIKLVKVPSQILNYTPSTPAPDGQGAVQVVSPTIGILGAYHTLTYTFSNGFSGFGAGIPGSIILPVTLLEFTGRLDKTSTVLNWSTSMEQNSKHFEIEKSTDGTHFNTIGSINAAGNSSNKRDYAFRDIKLNYANYYRLKMVDLDGNYKLSNVVLIRVILQEARISG
jgi:hypothetical protein